MISHQRKLSMILALTFAVASLVTLSAQAADVLSGTWKINIAKSTWSPDPVPKSSASVITVMQDGVRMVNDGINAKGEAVHLEYTAKFDGKDYPSKSTLNGKLNPDAADAVSWRKIDDYSYENTAKLKGQALTTTRMVVSKDGKTRTNTVTGKNAEGNAVNNKLVYDKQ